MLRQMFPSHFENPFPKLTVNRSLKQELNVEEAKMVEIVNVKRNGNVNVRIKLML